MALVLGGVIELAGVLVAIGILALSIVLTEAFFQVADTAVGWIPWVGKKASNGLKVTEKRLNARMSAWLVSMQGVAASSWHFLAGLAEETGKAIWDTAMLAGHVQWLVEFKYPLSGLSWLAHKAYAEARHVTRSVGGTVNNYYTYKGISTKRFGDLLRKVSVLSAAVAALQHAHAPSLGLPEVHIPSLPAALKGIRARLGRLEHKLGRNAFAALVAGALATLGVSWIRKSCAKRTSESFCRADSALLDVLTLGMVAVAVPLSFREFVQAAQSIEDEVINAISWTVPELAAAIDVASNTSA